MSETISGDSDIWLHAKDAIKEITTVTHYGRKNPAYAIERLGAIIASAEYEIKLLWEIQNDKA